MEKVTKSIYSLASCLVRYMSLILAGILLICGYLFTCYSEDMGSQLVQTKWDFLPASLLGLGVWFSIAWLLYHWTMQKPKKRQKLLLLAVMCWYTLCGLLLVLFGRTCPAADAASVYQIAEALAGGDTGVIHPTASYLSYYPQQVGLVAYEEILIRLWNLLPINMPAYHAMKCVNILWVCLLIYSQYRTVCLLFRKDSAGTAYLLLMFCNLPLVMYTSFLYGEVPSFAAFSAGLYHLLKLLEKTDGQDSSAFPLPSFLCSLFLFTVSVFLRKNTLILMIAVFLAVFLEALRRRRPVLLGSAVCYLLAGCLVLPAVTTYYEHRADNKLSSGVTALSYLAMGMQESSRGNGWYNGFNFNTYSESGMNSELANEISREAISERMAYFRQHPLEAFSFYSGKFLSQWADGTYASRQATLATFGGRSAFFQSVYEGSYSRYYIGFCNFMQNALYLGAFLFCLMALRGKTPFPCPDLVLYLCMIGVIGGFLFHMLWEANSRYILPYGLLLLPYAAYGTGLVSEFLEKARPRKG